MNDSFSLINPTLSSDNSFLGATSVPEIFEFFKEHNIKTAAITEFGNMNSAMDFYTRAKKANIMPILGMKVAIRHPRHSDFVEKLWVLYRDGKLKVKGKSAVAIDARIQEMADERFFTLTVHFKTQAAYYYFCRMSKSIWDRAIDFGGTSLPIMTLDELKGIAGDITVGFSSELGPARSWVANPDGRLDETLEIAYKDAESVFFDLKNTFKDDFYSEISPYKDDFSYIPPEKDRAGNIISEGTWQPRDIDIQFTVNSINKRLADKYQVPVMVSMNSYFTEERYHHIQDIRLDNGDSGIRIKYPRKIMSDVEVKMGLGIHDEDFKTFRLTAKAWSEKFTGFSIHTNKDRWILAGSSEEFLKNLKPTIDKWGRMDWSNPEMFERLKFEIDVLSNNGKLDLLPYLHTIEDIAAFCRENSVLMGVRGSAAGSLLLYLIGVSGANPLEHGLSFGRFLTVGRIVDNNTIPDVDMDVSDQEKVVAYLKGKYGPAVCRLSTDLLLRLKSSIKDIERAVLGKVRKTTEDLCKNLPTSPQGVDEYSFVFGHEDEQGNISGGLFDSNEDLKKYASENPDLWAKVKNALGIQRGKSVHSCGFVIADKDISEYIPLIKVNNDWVTAFSPKSVEAAGLVKFDLLGLNTLRDIQGALKSVKKRTGVELDTYKLDYDNHVWDEFVKGNVDGVFQFDTPTIRPYITATKPRSVAKTTALTALGRPGTLDAPSGLNDGRTLADLYVARSNGEPIQYLHPDLAPILDETQGVILYQEQIIKIFTEIGGMTDGEADEVRRGIGKKNKDVLIKATEDLKSKAVVRGWTEDQVDILIQQIMASANYSFNKSHACLAYDQEIETVNGPAKIGDIVSNQDKTPVKSLADDGSFQFIEPSKFFYQGIKEVFEVELEDGSKLKMTKDHLLLYNGKWVELGDLIDLGEIEVNET